MTVRLRGFLTIIAYAMGIAAVLGGVGAYLLWLDPYDEDAQRMVLGGLGLGAFVASFFSGFLIRGLSARVTGAILVGTAGPFFAALLVAANLFALNANLAALVIGVFSLAWFAINYWLGQAILAAAESGRDFTVPDEEATR